MLDSLAGQLNSDARPGRVARRGATGGASILKELASTSPRVRLWRFHAAVVIACGVHFAGGLPIPFAYFASVPMVAVLLYAATAGFRPGFRRWFQESPRWWLIPSIVLFVPVTIRILILFQSRHVQTFGLTSLIGGALAAPFLYGLVPRDGPIDKRDWTGAVWLFHLPVLCLVVGYWFGLQWHVSWFPRGPVPPLMLVFLGYVILIWDSRERFRWPRLSVGIALAVVLACLSPQARSVGHGSSPLFLSNLFRPLESLFSFPLIVEAIRDPKVLYELGPFCTAAEFSAQLRSLPQASAALAFIPAVFVGGFAAAKCLPLLLSVALVVWVRRRGLRLALLVPVCLVTLLCFFCTPPTFRGGGWGLPSFPPAPGWKAVGLTFLFGVLVMGASSRKVQLSPLPRGLRKVRDWGLGLLLFSSLVSLCLAVCFSLASWNLFPFRRPVAVHSELAPGSLRSAFRSLVQTGSDQRGRINFRRYPVHYDTVEVPDYEVEEYGLRTQRAALQAVARFADDHPQARLFPSNDTVGPSNLLIVISLENELGRSALWRGDLAGAVCATSVTLRTVNVVLADFENNRYPPIWSAEEGLQSTLDLIGGVVEALNQSPADFRRPEILQSLDVALNLEGGRSFLARGDVEALVSSMTGMPREGRWPVRLLIHPWLSIAAPGSRDWDSLYTGLIKYHWARVQVRLLLFRDRTGRFPESWEETERVLGGQPADGLVGFLDARFAAFLQIHPLANGDLAVSWTLPKGHPMRLPLSRLRMNSLRVVLHGAGPGGEDGR